MSDPSDPVLERRARIKQLTTRGQRVGYAVFAVATVAFFWGLAGDYSDALVSLIIGCLIVGSIVLAPSIVLSYAVRAADRADREDDW